MTVELVRKVFDAFGAGDVAALDDLYTEDYVLELPYAKPDPVRVEGRSAVQAYLTGAFQVFRFQLAITDHWKLEGTDALVAEYTSEGTVLPTGARYANTYVGIWRFRDGRVSRTKEWYDPIVSARAVEGLS
ncbi:MAG: putative PhzA/B-like protein [Actinomycetia bacterium]|nr:putative PhzA/B-like protein [Actinomycetes bacterium]